MAVKSLFLTFAMSYKNIILLFFLAAIAACTGSDRTTASSYEVRDYRTVKLYLDTLNEKLRAEFERTGSYTVPYTQLKNGKKSLIFFGASHVRDVHHPQFSQLAEAFIKLQPEIAFNEGGQIPADRRYASRDSAILLNGETGLLKLLCDSAGIKMMDGDMDESEEMNALKKTIPMDQIYLYMAVERYLNGYKNGHFPDISLEEGWQRKFVPYLQRAGLGLTPAQESFDTLKTIYHKYLHREFVLDSLVEVYEFYLTDDGVLGDVGRATKIVRDQALLSKIDRALDEYDRVFVVFGGSHRLAVEPALRQIIGKKRN
jgi:hypothetical protein